MGENTSINNIKIEFLEKKYYFEVISLQNIIINQVDNAFYFPSSPEEIRDIFTNGLAVGAFCDERLIGFASFIFPKDNSLNLGNDVPFFKNNLLEVVHLESIFVHPQFRGKRLQNKMYSLGLKRVKDKGLARYGCATVAPYNYPSLKSFLKIGFIIVNLVEKYNGDLRYILFKDLDNPLNINKSKAIDVSENNLLLQKDLFVKGYYAYEIKKYKSDEYYLLFRRRNNCK